MKDEPARREASAAPKRSEGPVTERERAAFQTEPLHEEDFYLEAGLMVFTAAYHLRRGYCCNSTCRHCPYK